MEGQEYAYRIRPLLVSGGTYLVLFPVLTAALWFIFKVSDLELFILAGIYALTALCLIGLWVYGYKKSIRVEADHIMIKTWLVSKKLEPQDIKRITHFETRNGREGVYIKTGKEDYYLNEQYFPFPELMSDLEYFVTCHGIRSNFSSL